MRITINVDTHIRVPRDAVDFERVQTELWISNASYEARRAMGLPPAKKEVQGVALWEDDGDFLRLPRGYGPPLLPGVEAEYQDVRTDPELTDDWGFRLKLRPRQLPAADALMASDSDKLLCLGCGIGKTVLALWYAGQRRKKTLVIVDRDFLLEQWKREAKRCFFPLPGSPGLRPEEIGTIQGKTRTIGEKLTVAMVHTLSQQEFDSDFYGQFDLVVIDECHTAGAPLFSTVLPNFQGERLLLSATPTRADGMHPVFMLHAGGMEPCYTDIAREQSTNWFFKQLPRCISEEDESRCYRRMYEMSRRYGRNVSSFMRPRYDSYVGKSEIFNSIIVDEVRRAADAGRNVLLLGGRVEQLTTLYKVFEGSYDVGLVVGNVKSEERVEAFQKQVIFATDKIASRALDIARLDTLYLLFPTEDANFLRQAVGRIDREYANKRKPFCVVFDHSYIPKMAKKAEKMVDTIRSIDPKANIRRMR